jgi:hypothetical protein
VMHSTTVREKLKPFESVALACYNLGVGSPQNVSGVWVRKEQDDREWFC